MHIGLFYGSLFDTNGSLLLLLHGFSIFVSDSGMGLFSCILVSFIGFSPCIWVSFMGLI